MKKGIFLAYRSEPFFLKSLLITTKLLFRELEICKHWNPSITCIESQLQFTIYSAEYLGIVTIKVWMAICFRLNGEEKSTTFPIPKMKLIRYNVSFLEIQSFCPSISEKLSINFDLSQNVSAVLLFNALVMVANEWWIACQFSK